jgi:hypothetical protein
LSLSLYFSAFVCLCLCNIFLFLFKFQQVCFLFSVYISTWFHH